MNNISHHISRKKYNKVNTNVIYYINDKMSDTEYAEAYNIYVNSRRSWAPQGRRLGDECLEVLVLLVAPGELPRVGRNWAAVGYPKKNKRKKVEEASVSTQRVLNKYNTNYEALRLADSTALAFNLGKCNTLI